jgi:uncharacterized membrane protein
MQRKALDPRVLAVIAVMTAIVFVLTQIKLFPTPDGGYVHLGDAGIFFSAFAFGPWIGAAIGGLGTALADITGGFAQWAIFSFVIHGLQGYAAGWLSKRFPGLVGLVLGTIVGSIIVVVGYLPAGMLLTSPAQALASLPWNVLQVAVGAVVGIPLFVAVRQAYPPILNLGRPRR